MKGLQFMILVTHRECAEQFLDFFSKNKIERVFTKLCRGTATDSMLNILGLEATEKVMFEAVVREEQISDLRKKLITEMNMETSGNGITIFLPLDSIGGESALKYLAGDSPVAKTEENKVENKNKIALIMSIVDKGFTDILMDSARQVGATGGTVVRAKGTGSEIAKFFGVSISEEKEIVYIVADMEKRDAIMHAIMQSAGTGTEGHGIVFSLPVDSVMGIRSLENI